MKSEQYTFRPRIKLSHVTVTDLFCVAKIFAFKKCSVFNFNFWRIRKTQKSTEKRTIGNKKHDVEDCLVVSVEVVQVAEPESSHAQAASHRFPTQA
jgi:hypothetical protein